MVNKMLPVDRQYLLEDSYYRGNIDKLIKQEILDNSDICHKMEQGREYLSNWMTQEYFESKDKRLARLHTLDLEQLILDILIGVAYCQIPELFTSVTAQLASRLKFSEKEDGIRTIGEILAVLCQTDAFDIIKPSKDASLMVQSRIPLSDKVIRYVEQSNYLPPMVSEPEWLTHNYQSAYYSFDDSVVLGSGNHHNGDLCLDVLNIKNSTALSLCTEFLSTVEEEPTKELDTHVKAINWDRFKTDSYKFYRLMVGQGNRFFLTHKPDTRGRIYAQGYHITTQGSPFKKAMLEFADKEIVEGVPNG